MTTWDPPGSDPDRPKWHAAVAAVGDLARHLDRVDATCRNAVNAAVAEYDYEVARARVQSDALAEARAHALGERMEQTLAELDRLVRPAGRAGAAALGVDGAPPASAVGPALLRVGTMPLDGRFREPVAYVPSHRNIEVVALREEHENRAYGIVRALLLRRLLDATPGSQRVLVVDHGRVTGPLLELAELNRATPPLITFAVDTASALDELRRVTAEVHRAHLHVLRGEHTIGSHNLVSTPENRLAFTTIVLPNGFGTLDPQVVALIEQVADEGPDAGVTVMVRSSRREPARPLPHSTELQVGTDLQVIDASDVTVALTVAADPAPPEALVRSVVHDIVVTTGRPRPTPATQPANDEITSERAWPVYLRLLRSATHELRQESAQLDEDSRAARKLDAALRATRDHRLAVVASHQKRIEHARSTERAMGRELGFVPAPSQAPGRSDLSKGVDGLLSALENDVDHVVELLAAAVVARDHARTEELERQERERRIRHARDWVTADAAKARDRRQAVPACIVIVATFLLWVSWAAKKLDVLTASGVTLALALVTFLLLLIEDATRSVIHHLGRWPTAYHPDDRDEDTSGTVTALRPWLAGALVLSSATAGVIVVLLAGGGARRTFAVIVLGSIAAFLWSQTTPSLSALSTRSRRFSATRPHRNTTER